MKIQETKNKLVLNKRTISNLNQIEMSKDEMNHIEGGIAAPTQLIIVTQAIEQVLSWWTYCNGCV